jgi:hypothetical protein
MEQKLRRSSYARAKILCSLPPTDVQPTREFVKLASQFAKAPKSLRRKSKYVEIIADAETDKT